MKYFCLGFIVQEKSFDYGWIDVYENDDYDFCCEIYDVLKNKYKDKEYRIVEVL